MTNSIVVTEQELKELMSKGFFVRVEPVKKGDTPVYLGYNNTLSKTGPISEIWNKSGETIADVGDVFSVKNKKGDFAWFSKSNNISFLKNNKPFPKFKKAGWKPLLVRLCKIKEQKTMYINNWLETFWRMEK